VRIELGMSVEDPTADYRKYPKGPNFLLIVILASVVLVLLLVASVLLVGRDGRKLSPHSPNPQPNSLIQPLRAGGMERMA
jgi:hypothetical protein